MFIEKIRNYLAVILMALVLPFCGYTTEQCAIRIFDCGQGNTVAARYENQTMVFDAGKTAYSKFVRHNANSDDNSTAPEIYSLEATDDKKITFILANSQEITGEDSVEDALEEFKGRFEEFVFTGNTLNSVFISHPHKDHYSLFNYLGLSKSKYVILGGDSSKYSTSCLDVNGLGKKVLNKSQKQLNAHACCSFSERKEEAPIVEILSMNAGNKVDPNKDSMIVRLSHNGHSMLITGDAEEETWNDVFENYKYESLKTDILLLSHHGSQTHGSTSELVLEIIKPSICLISAGFQHGHPCLETILLLKKYYKKNNFRTKPHFVTYYDATLPRSVYTDLPIFTTMDHASLTVNLTQLTIETSRSLSIAPVTTAFWGDNFCVSFKEDPRNIIYDFKTLKNIHGKFTLPKCQLDADDEIYCIKGNYYFKNGDLFCKLKTKIKYDSYSSDEEDSS